MNVRIDSKNLQTLENYAINELRRRLVRGVPDSQQARRAAICDREALAHLKTGPAWLQRRFRSAVTDR